MTEWTLYIKTAAGIAPGGEADLVRFDNAIQAHPRALGPCAAMNVEEGSLDATFTVAAADARTAVDAGIAAVTAALEFCDLRPVIARVELEPAEGEKLQAA